MEAKKILVVDDQAEVREAMLSTDLKKVRMNI